MDKIDYHKYIACKNGYINKKTGKLFQLGYKLISKIFSLR